MMKRETLLSLLLFFALLLTWEVLVRVKGIPELILPTPSAVAQNLVEHISSGYLIKHALTTLNEILAGFAVGALLGIGLGFIVSQSEKINRIIHPYIIASQAMPKLALAPLLVLWFGYGILPKIIITALISFFPLFESTVSGLRYVDQNQFALFQTYKATKLQILLKLRLPTAVPYLFSGIRAALVLSVVGAVVSEFVGASKGLGAVIMTAQGMMDTPLIFSSFILLTIMGLVLYQVSIVIERKLLKKYTIYRGNLK